VNDSLLAVSNLVRHYRVTKAWGGGGVVRAVDGITFRIGVGEAYALVGESGCGKSTTARLCLKLEEPTSGTIEFAGRPVDRRSLRAFRAAVQPVFQNPYASLDPRMRIGSIIAEPLVADGGWSRADRGARVAEVLEQVGIPAASARLFPHEFSGGQRQRIALARALAPRPRLLVLDEPVSALDMSIRGQIMNLLQNLRRADGLSYLMISHDLATVRHLSDRIGVMYLGKLVEEGDAEEIFTAPRHPYTRLLLDSVLDLEREPMLDTIADDGEIADTLDLPSGCAFHPRCPVAEETCSAAVPELEGDRHRVACHLAR
jgi:oligopeptide/dipeptide ABC transporter ATP-binding protein